MWYWLSQRCFNSSSTLQVIMCTKVSPKAYDKMWKIRFPVVIDLVQEFSFKENLADDILNLLSCSFFINANIFPVDLDRVMSGITSAICGPLGKNQWAIYLSTLIGIVRLSDPLIFLKVLVVWEMTCYN